ncbi:MAG: 5'/3'-nucleotidase SurE [Candidatus Poseidoniaceae archaeon]
MDWILVTNDDGIEAVSLQSLVTELARRDYGVIVFAPSENNSAVSMAITLGKPISIEEVPDDRNNVRQFSIGGTPCDCVIAALDGGIEKFLPGILPKLLVSGINLGPNLSQDAYHSGTMAAAREAGMYGMPAIASSWSSFDPEGMEVSIDATVKLIEAVLPIVPDVPSNLNRPHVDVSAPHLTKWPHESEELWRQNPIKSLRTCFANGEIFLNLNVPVNWNSNFRTTRLGMRWYRSAISFGEDTSTFRLGAARIDTDVVYKGDVDADKEGFASVSCLPCWPHTHPLEANPELLAWCLENSAEGLPVWF